MSGWTVEKAQAGFDRWLAADIAVAAGQSYSIGIRSFTRADAEEIAERLDFYDKKLKELAAGTTGGLIISQQTIIDT
ncbi:MAG: hypothetical protein KOO69_00250 [Victivallales bacterium]|nr:hypothetical protein [Victivallales bacterium]